MNRTVKLLLVFFSLTFSFTSSCFASWDGDDDDFYNYYAFDTDGDGEDDMWVTTDEDGHGTAIGYINDEGRFEYEVIGDSGTETDSNDDGGTDASWENEESDYDESIDSVEDDNGNDDDDVEVGDDDKSLSKYKKYKLTDLKKDILIKKIRKRTLPDKFVPQDKGSSQCTARAIATAEQLCGGDYNSAYEIAMDLADKTDHNLNEKRNGITEDDMVKTYQDYCDIDRERFSEKRVDSHMDNGEIVFGIIDTDSGSHMVTIVASDWNHYYCASGFEDAQQIPKEDFKNHDIFIYNGKNIPYK